MKINDTEKKYNTDKDFIMKIKVFYFVFLFCFSFKIGFCSESNEGIEDFFKYPDPEKTSGSIVVADKDVLNNTNVSKIITIYSWDKGNFLSEMGLADENDQFSIKKLLSASGKWDGKNWSFYSDGNYLSYITKLSKSQLEYVRGINGRFPKEAEFAKIIGRGVDILELKDFERQGRIVKGFVQQKRVPINGQVERRGDEYIFVYNFTGSDLIRSNVMKLREFNSGTYIPSYLTTYFINNGTTILENNYVVLVLTNKPVKNSLSPFILYKDAKIFEQVGERVFSVENGLKKEIPVERPGTKQEFLFSDKMGKTTLLLIGLIIFISVIAILLWISIKARGKF